MKRLTFFFLALILFASGCFDGERGLLTELIVNPLPEDTFHPARPFGGSDKVKAGTGSDLVISPVPPEIQDALWGNWEELMDDLKVVMSIHKGGWGIDPESGELVLHKLEPTATPLFAAVCTHSDNRRFYTKYIDAGGIVAVGHNDSYSGAYVRDEFLYAARQIILTITSEMPELRQAMSPENGFYYVLIGAYRDEVNLPDELSLFNRYAGFFTASSQLGSLRYLAAGGIYYHISLEEPEEALWSGTVVHEMAHAIDYTFDLQPHLFPGWDARLTALYKAAYQKALNGEGYFDDIRLHAMLNKEEYWATGAQDWFTEIHGDAVFYEWERTRLIEQDPLLYALLDEVFPAVNLPKYIWIEDSQ